MSPVRLAVFGAGLIGRRHIELIRAEPEAALAGVVEPDPETGRRLSEAGLPVFGDLDALAAVADVQGAVVATPNDTHAELTAACAARGWAVLVEKPIAPDPAAARAMIETCARYGVPLLVGHHRRYHPCVAVARGFIGSGGLGRLAAVSAHWAARKPESYFAQPWRSADAGGPVLINLIHDIDLLRCLCGDIRSLTAEAASAVRGGPVEDSAALTLSFASGALGSVILSDAALSPWSWEGASGENPHIAETGQASHRFMGTQGSLELPSLRLWRAADAAAADWGGALRAEMLAAERAAPLPAQLSHFIAVIRGTAEPLVTGEEGLASLIATLAVLEAARTGRRVDLS